MTAQLTAVLDLTDQVQAAIDGGDWSRARELDVARREAIAQLVVERAADPHVGDALTELYARNQRMLGDVDRARRRLLRENALLKTGQAAVAAYDDASS
ncbi:MAG TPA: hypothetical protein VL131_07665 [Gammaproteobacteria bacterium]|nr:hypothetical protein [Gammaproteobacteria bacterium]